MKISLSKSELSSLYRAVAGVLEENENLHRRLRLFRDKWDHLDSLLKELETIRQGIDHTLRQNSTRIAYINQYLSKFQEDGSPTIQRDKEPPPKPGALSPEKRGGRGQVIPGKKVEGVMLFVSPDPNLEDTSGFATRQPRRELLPTETEERMILDYVREQGIKLTKSEYRTIYKKVSNMLVSAPRNAVAIQIRLKKIPENRKILELFYHVSVNNRLEAASFKYIEIKGVEYYRSLKSV